jgi:hypothetical protein
MQLVLTEKAKKLIRLCEIEGHKDLDDLIRAMGCDSVCPAICMTEGCDYTMETESDQREGARSRSQRQLPRHILGRTSRVDPGRE